MESIKKIMSQMSLEEKAQLCSGLDFWRTKPIERLGVPSIMVSDGPHGLRKQKDEADHLGMNDSIDAICFPSGATMACSWDVELLKTVGTALGVEAQAENVAVLLGPAVNIKRSPLCGRNFEYYSEDPLLSTRLATSFIQGVQSQGVGTSIKHFAANNQEFKRMATDTIVDERTLREIYLASFEGAIKEAQPWTVMCAYNQLNGEFCSQNERLLTTILKEEWGHEGIVVSDWGAVVDREKGIAAGLELEMPSSHGVGDKRIVDAVNSGELSLAALDQAVERLLTVIFKVQENRKENVTYNKSEHHRLAKQVAAESMVLLRNENQILPLDSKQSLGIIGAFAKKPRFQGGGSSHIRASQIDDITLEIQSVYGEEKTIPYAPGFVIHSDDIDEALVDEAVLLAQKVEKVILFIGLPDHYESEGYDRTHLSIPYNQIALLESIYKVNKKIIVVLCNGSPIEMPWINKTEAILEGYLGGQALGGAIAELLFGVINPSGKLSETFPMTLEHNPSYLNFPGENEVVDYREGIFVGYRYYQKKNIKPLFPFGFGLSYTQFKYSDLQLSRTEIRDDETVTISVTIENSGNCFGKEIVQLYVADTHSSVVRPQMELKGFQKVALAPGECKQLVFELDKRAFAYYHVGRSDWQVETGSFKIHLASSSDQIELSTLIQVTTTQPIRKTITRNTIVADIWDHPLAQPFVAKFMDTFQSDSDALGMDFSEMMKGSVLRGLTMMGIMTDEQLQQFINALNE